MRGIRGLRLICSLLFIFIFIFSFVSSAESVVVNQQPTQAEPKHWYSSFTAVFKSPIFWGILIFLIGFGILAIIAFFVIRAILRFIKMRRDLYFRMKSEKLAMAKAHARFPCSHWLKVTKNPPIRLVKVENGRLVVSNPIGYYRGDYTSNRGHINIACNMGKKILFFFPVRDLIIIPDRDTIKIVKRDKVTQAKVTEEILNLPRANNIVQFNDGEILIFADSLSSVGEFKIPVMRDENGAILDLSLPVYQMLRETAQDDYMYELHSELVHVSKEAVAMNPYLRAKIKETDSNQNVELPQNNNNNNNNAQG